MVREQARARRQAEIAQKRQARERERAIRDAQKKLVIQQKEAKQRHLESMLLLAEQQTEELNDRLIDLQNILQHTFEINDAIDFDSLIEDEEFELFNPPQEIKNPAEPPSRQKYLDSVKSLNRLGQLIPGAKEKHKKALLQAEETFRKDMKTHENKEEARQNELARLSLEYQKKKEEFLLKVREHNKEIDEFRESYKACDPNAVIAYNTMVLERSEYSDGFPQEFRVAYVPESKELVIEYELPGASLIPATAEYKYVKSKDVIEEKPRKPTEVKEIYQDIVASICLRTIHEVLEADQNDSLAVVVFNGFVQAVDPATGQDIRPCLISVRTTKEVFKKIDLSRIEKKACLRNLGAQVSPRPAELQAVKPVIEFDMVDKRFVEQSDILGDLESRPNLMDLNPFEFENLVSNLFERMGLETKQTRSSKDGGVDAVAFDNRPVLGGKVIIQAKRYKNLVGVSAVRDLYGTMVNEGANKGILVTTSHYGPDAYDFAKDKPIELIDGGGLLYLLDQVDVKARIVFPED